MMAERTSRTSETRISQVPQAAKGAARRMVAVALVALLGSAIGVRLALPAKAAQPAVAVQEGLTVRYAVDGDCSRQVFVAPEGEGPWERVGEVDAGHGVTLRLQGEVGMRVGLASEGDLDGAIGHTDHYAAPGGEPVLRTVTLRCGA